MNLEDSISFVENNINSCDTLDQIETARQMAFSFVLDKFNHTIAEYRAIQTKFNFLIENKISELSELNQ